MLTTDSPGVFKSIYNIESTHLYTSRMQQFLRQRLESRILNVIKHLLAKYIEHGNYLSGHQIKYKTIDIY